MFCVKKTYGFVDISKYLVSADYVNQEIGMKVSGTRLIFHFPKTMRFAVTIQSEVFAIPARGKANKKGRKKMDAKIA